MNETPEFIGYKILDISVSHDEERLNFLVEKKDIKFLLHFDTDGDCCSQTWWADITDIQNLINEKVIGVMELDLPDYNILDGRGRQSEDIAYGYRVTTKKGDCDFIFRNSSNGYYGGGCGKGVFNESADFHAQDFGESSLSSLIEWHA